MFDLDTFAPVPSLRLDVLDVGQGDGLILWLPKGKVIVVDMGSTKNKGITGDAVMKYLKDHTPFGQFKQDIEWLVLTHGDRDHYNLIETLLDNFAPTVERALFGGEQKDYPKEFMTKLRSWMNRKSPEDAAVYFGGETLWKTMYEQDGVEVKIMAAGVSAGSGGYLKNTRSVVLRVRYAGRTIILTGDGTVSTENAVVRFIEKHGGKPADELKADVLKVGHHGSHRTSNSASWIKLVNPYFAFFSADRSGSLDERKATGHRLPQALTASLMLKHAPRLKGQTNKGHDYIVSFQKKDYKEYNKHPDIKDDELEMPMYDAKNEWQTWSDGSGLITTLVKMGVSDTDADEADKGAQWQVVIKDTGHLDVRST